MSISKTVSKFFILVAVALVHIVLFALLGPINIFRSTPIEGDEQNFQQVKIALPPPPAKPPPPPQPAASLLFPAATISVPLSTPDFPLATPAVSFKAVSTPALPTEIFAKPSIGNSGSGTSTNISPESDGKERKVSEDKPLPSDSQRPALVHPKKKGSTLIFNYIQDGDIEAAKRWLEDGNDPNVAKPIQDHTWWPIMAAIRFNQPEIVRMLLENGANPDPPEVPDQRWSRTVSAAIWVRSPEMLKMLLDYGARPDYGAPSDPDYVKCRDWTRWSGENSVLQVFDDSDDQTGRPNSYSQEKQVEMLGLLLEHGAAASWKDNSGRTPMSLAQGSHREDLVMILKKYLKH